MRPIKRYVASIKAFFTPFILVKLSQFYSFTSPVLLPKNKRLWNGRKEDFLHLWLFQSIVLYQRSKKIHVQTQLDFRHRCLYNQPKLTNWWNYSIFVQILYSYFEYTDSLFLGCVLFALAVILPEFLEKPRRKD